MRDRLDNESYYAHLYGRSPATLRSRQVRAGHDRRDSLERRVVERFEFLRTEELA